MPRCALEDAAAGRGLRPLGRTTQDRLLIANGILERFAEQEDQAWRRLADPFARSAPRA